MLRNGDLITSEIFEPNLTGFKNLSGLVSDIIEFSFLNNKKLAIYAKTIPNSIGMRPLVLDIFRHVI
jgi:hypothetical protein